MKDEAEVEDAKFSQQVGLFLVVPCCSLFPCVLRSVVGRSGISSKKEKAGAEDANGFLLVFCFGDSSSDNQREERCEATRQQRGWWQGYRFQQPRGACCSLLHPLGLMPTPTLPTVLPSQLAERQAAQDASVAAAAAAKTEEAAKAEEDKAAAVAEPETAPKDGEKGGEELAGLKTGDAEVEEEKEEQQGGGGKEQPKGGGKQQQKQQVGKGAEAAVPQDPPKAGRHLQTWRAA